MTLLESYLLFHKGIQAFSRAERQGIRVDLDYCKRILSKLSGDIDLLEQEFIETNFFKHWQRTTKNKVNIHSGQQLARYLYKTKGIAPAKETETGQGSTDDDALTNLGIPELDSLLKIRKLKKIRDTYFEGIIREQMNGVVHPSFNLHFARSYRSSSDSPNFQNIPKRDVEAMTIIRSALFPRKGHQLAEIDFKGIEVAVAACYHKDPTMLKYIKDKLDMHGDMAVRIFKCKKDSPQFKVLRSAAKNGFVFPQFYGDYYKNNAISLACEWCKLPEGKWKPGQGIEFGNKHISDHLIEHGITSLQVFTKHIEKIEHDLWYNRFPVYRKWKERWWAEYQKKGYIDMFTGFRCIDLLSKNEAINRPIQGAAFHCLLWAFIRLDEIMVKANWKSRLIGQIHDAIVFDIHPDERDMVIETARRVMTKELPEAWKWIIVPLEVEVDIGGVDESWAELKSSPH